MRQATRKKKLTPRQIAYLPKHSLRELLEAEEHAIQRLHAAGFIDYGNVDEHIEYTEGGIAVKLGGRKRYVLAGTNLRATVGRVTTLFYQVDGEEVTFLARVPTIQKRLVVQHINRFRGYYP